MIWLFFFFCNLCKFMFDGSLSLRNQYVDLYFSRRKFLSDSNNFHVLPLTLELDQFLLKRFWGE